MPTTSEEPKREVSERERFVRLLEYKQQMNEARWALEGRLRDHALERVIEYKKLSNPRWKPKKGSSDLTALTDESRRLVALTDLLDTLEEWEKSALLRPLKDLHRDSYERLSIEVRWTAARISRLAQTLRPQPGEEWRTLRKVSGSSYHTQGYGANAYAQASAEMTAMGVEALGVEVRVKVIKIPRPEYRGSHYVHTDDFAVECKVAEEFDLEIIRHLPGLSFRDWLKACWKKGVNPRVYHPGLPWGIEAKLGIDHFGNDVPNPSSEVSTSGCAKA